jgi:Caspase domain
MKYIFFFIIIFATTIQAQTTLNYTIRYPDGNPNTDNSHFQFAQVQLSNTGANEYPIYQLTKKDWELGQVFQLVIHPQFPLPSEKKSGYMYVLGLTAKNEITNYFPNDYYNQLTNAPNNDIIVPAPYNGWVLQHPSKEQFVVLHSITPLEDYATILQNLKKTSGTLRARVQQVMSDKLAKPTQLKYENDKLFVTENTGTTITPLFIDIQIKNPLPTPKGKLYAVCFAPAFVDLEFNQKDAKDIATLLASQKGKTFTETNIQIITGKKATKAAFLNAITDIMKNNTIKKEDKVIVYMSAHGYLSNEEHIIQAAGYDALYPTATSIKSVEIFKALAKAPCPIITLIDAAVTNAIEQPTPSIIPPTAIVRPLKVSNLHSITSNSKDERSWENTAWQNSAFTKAFLEGASGKADTNENGLLSLGELFQYAQKRTKDMVQTTLQKNQTPVFTTGDFVDFDLLSY